MRNRNKKIEGQKSLFAGNDLEMPEKGQDSARDIMKQKGLGYRYIRDNESAAEAVSWLKNAKLPLGLDTETAKLPEFKNHEQAGLEPHLSRIRLIQLYGGGDTVYIFDMYSVGMEVLKPIWKMPLIAHNAVFDLKNLLHAGADPQQIGCTMLMANALTGKLPSLANLAKEHLGWNMSKSQQASNWDNKKLTPEQLNYSALDVMAVFKLYRILKKLLIKRGLGSVYIMMREAMRAVAKMELNGIYFNAQAQKKLIDRWQQEKEKAENELTEILGPYINIDSSKQISSWLKTNLDSKALRKWPKTKSGQLKTDAQTLKRFPGVPLLKPFQKYKDASKMLSTFGAGYAEHINPETGRIHPYFRIGGTATGRISCFKPNIQNPPRDKEFRALFSAPPGREIVVADYGQIELRVAALVSGDEDMLEAYAKGQDLHRKTAAAIADVPIEKVNSEQRQAAKAVNFGLLYGQGYKGLARYAKASYGVDMSENDAKQAREAFFDEYLGLRCWQEETARIAEKTQKAITPCGRIRDFTKEQRGYRYTEALNTPIQGGAAEILMAALSKLEKHFAGLDAKLVNIVHDELVLEVSELEVEQAKKAVEKAMIEGMLEVFPDASTVGLVEAKSGSNWAEAK